MSSTSLTMFEYMSNILRNGGSKLPNGRLQSDLVSETLLEELNSRMKEVDECKRQREAQSKRDSGVPDYSWLVSNSEQPYKITNVLKIELEDLTTQIEPDDTCHIINNFRKSINDDTLVQDIPECFKAVLKRHIVIKNLKTMPKEKDKLKTLQRFNEPSNLLTVKPDLAHLREKEVRVNLGGARGMNNTRVNSAPASSWRFFKQSKIKPVNSSQHSSHRIDNDCNDKERRANSVPTITTIV